MINELKSYLDRAHSPYHAVAALAEDLAAAGYTCLLQQEDWQLAPGGKYYVVCGGSSLFAFRIPEGACTGFMMSAAHCDRPGFKVKENLELTGAYTRLATEKYGGMLMSTWLDRPLSVAGRALVETENGVQTRLIDIDRDLLLIPNVSIHLNRGVNDGYKWNPAVDTLPLLGGKEAAGKLAEVLEEAAGGKILGHDLFLYLRQKAQVWGMDGEYISAQGLDDLACVWGCARGFMDAAPSAAVPVLCVFDNEEVGSASAQGADSTVLADLLGRICAGMHYDLPRMLKQSFMVSADNAHGLHPNHPELSDGATAPVLGGGVAIKFHGDHRYTTDGLSAALFRKLCGVTLQRFYNRGDLPSGSTLGTISTSQVSVMSVDIGLPQLAMHSAFETAAVKDAEDLVSAMTAYYSRALRAGADGDYTIL